jgi:hypothetical protein
VNSSSLKFLKSWGFLLFAFLVVFRVALWLSIECPDHNDINIDGTYLNQSDTVVKVHNLPIRFMAFWPDSNRYWFPPSDTFRENLSRVLNDQYFINRLFFWPVRALTDNYAYGILAQNILSLLSAWLLFVMLRRRGNAFAAAIVFISYTNLFTISMEYALLREVLARFLLILFVFLLWRMFASPGWKLAVATGASLFFLACSRQELMIIPFLIIPILFWRISSKYAAVILIIGLVGVCASIRANTTTSSTTTSSQTYQQLINNLVVESYNYESSAYEGLSEEVYTEVMHIKSDYKVGPQTPSIRSWGFWVTREKIVQKWLERNSDYSKCPTYSRVKERLPDLFEDISAIVNPSVKKTITGIAAHTPLTVEEVRELLINEKGYADEELPNAGTIYDILSDLGYPSPSNLALYSYKKLLFLDVLRHNTKYVVYSALYSFWSYMTGNLFTISPLIYNGDNPNYKFGWPYYSSTNLSSFGDPLSELTHDERGSKLLPIIMAPFSEYWYRKICAPFFFIGLFCICRIFFFKRKSVPASEMGFWLLAVLLTVTLLIISSIVGVRGSRRVFSIDPFIFSISILGMQVIGRKIFAGKVADYISFCSGQKRWWLRLKGKI